MRTLIIVCALMLSSCDIPDTIKDPYHVCESHRATVAAMRDCLADRPACEAPQLSDYRSYHMAKEAVKGRCSEQED